MSSFFLLFNRSKGFHLVFISFLAYLIVNLLENLVHYNIGKESHDPDNKLTSIHMTLPNSQDWAKIIYVMFAFALFQGVLTLFFNKIM